MSCLGISRGQFGRTSCPIRPTIEHVFTRTEPSRSCLGLLIARLRHLLWAYCTFATRCASKHWRSDGRPSEDKAVYVRDLGLAARKRSSVTLQVPCIYICSCLFNCRTACSAHSISYPSIRGVFKSSEDWIGSGGPWCREASCRAAGLPRTIAEPGLISSHPHVPCQLLLYPKRNTQFTSCHGKAEACGTAHRHYEILWGQYAVWWNRRLGNGYQSRCAATRHPLIRAAILHADVNTHSRGDSLPTPT